MVRHALVLTVLLGLGFAAGDAWAVKWFPYTSKDYKIKVCLNTGMKVDAGREGKWGVLTAKDGDVNIVIMAYAGKAHFADMQKAAVAMSKVPAELWKKTRETRKWNGFGHNATYIATGPDRLLIAFLGHHGTYVDRNYIVFINTAKKTFLANQKAFEAWGECLAAVP